MNSQRRRKGELPLVGRLALPTPLHGRDNIQHWLPAVQVIVGRGVLSIVVGTQLGIRWHFARRRDGRRRRSADRVRPPRASFLSLDARKSGSEVLRCHWLRRPPIIRE
jgi:hypothetical protein